MVVIIDKIRKIGCNIKTFKRVYKLLSKSNFNYILLNLCITVILGIMPTILIIIMKELINLLQHIKGGLGNILLLSLLYVVVDLSNTLLVNLDEYYGNKFNLKFAGEIKTIVLDKTKCLSLKQFEDPTTYNIIQRAERESDLRVFSYYSKHLLTVKQLITLISTSIILILWKWWMVLAISIIPLILSFKMLQINEEHYFIHRKRTEKERKLWYISYLLTNDIAFKEIKLNNLTDYCVNKYRDIYKTVIDSEVPIIKKRVKYVSVNTSTHTLIGQEMIESSQIKNEVIF